MFSPHTFHYNHFQVLFLTFDQAYSDILWHFFFFFKLEKQSSCSLITISGLHPL